MCILETGRLLLRPPERRDIPAIVPLANDFDVAKNLSTLPHPYTVADGENFVAMSNEKREAGTDFNFAIVRKSDGAYMGGIGLHTKDGDFEFGYWLGKIYWREGYATEAAQRVIDDAVQLAGGLGVKKGSAVEALYREIRALRIYEGASEVQKLVIARQELQR